MSVAVEADNIDTQYAATYELAETAAGEVLSLTGDQLLRYKGRGRGCGYAWRPHALPVADVLPKVSPLAIAWRTGFSVLRRLQRRCGQPGWRFSVFTALAELRAVGSRIFHDPRAAEWSPWLTSVEAALHNAGDRAIWGSLVR